MQRSMLARLLVATTLAAALLGGVLLYGSRDAAAVVTLTPASGGTGLSADTAGNATTPAWTSLGAITITEGLAADIAVGAGDTLILTAPAGFEFNTAQVPDVTGITADLTSLAMSYPTSTTMQLLYTSAGTAVSDVLVIGGVTAIQVRQTVGTPLAASADIVRATGNAGTGTIAGVTLDSTNFGSLSMVVGAVAQLGITTQPAGATAGAVFGTQPLVRTEDQFASASTTGLGASLNVTAALTTGTDPLQGTAALDIGTGAGNGTVTHTDLRLDVAEAGKILTFSATGLTSIASAGFAVGHGAATQLAVTTQPSASSASSAAFAQQPIVTIRDAFGNTVTADSTTVVSAALTTGTGTLAGTATETAAAGIADFVGNGLAIDLVGTDKVLTFTGGGFTAATTGAFTITSGAAAGATSTITAAPTSFQVNGAGSTITVQLEDPAGNNLTAGGDAVVLGTTVGALGAVTDNTDGTYTATLTSTATGTATVSGTVNAAGITDTAIVTVTAVPPPPPPPANEPEPKPTTLTEGGVEVPVADAASGTVADGSATTLSSSGDSGSVTASVPSGALPAGTTLMLGTVTDPTALATDAPTAFGVQLLSGFVAQATAADGSDLGGALALPVPLTLTVAAAAIPAGVPSGDLVAAFWNGLTWEQLDAVRSEAADGSIAFAYDAPHLSIYGILHRPHQDVILGSDWNLLVWHGIEGQATPDALAVISPSGADGPRGLYRLVAGEWERHLVGAPAFAQGGLDTIADGDIVMLRMYSGGVWRLPIR